MRKCGNCYYGHFNLSERGEEMFCTESGFMEEWVDENSCCDSHIFETGYENEKNYLLYDDEYLGPGYFIINKKNNEINKFLKIYIMNSFGGFPSFGLRAFCIDAEDKAEMKFNNIEFTFRNLEDDDNGLFEIFTNLCYNLNGSIVPTIDQKGQGENNFKLETDSKITRLIISKDVYKGDQHPTDFIDINIGDDYSCQNYEAIMELYNRLVSLNPLSIKKQDIKQLVKLKI